MERTRHHILTLALAALALSGWACALPVTGQSNTPAPGEAPVQEGEPASTTPTGTGPGDSQPELFMSVAGGVAITQTTPETGNGPYPVFAWEPVEGAARYMLFVFHQAGGGYWSWEGTATRVMLGGFDAPPPPTADGPRLTGPMVWAVVALDADDHFIASSPLRPVAP